MKVIRAGIIGFCMGVRRAVDIALRPSGTAGAVYTLGPLIHNTRVLRELKRRGVGCLNENEISRLPIGSTVIIRAHGISPLVETELQKKGHNVLDATCPRVKLSQSKAKDFAERGYVVFLAGEENHAEIEGIRGFVDGKTRCFVVGDAAGAEKAAMELSRAESTAKTVLIGQTTFGPEEYHALEEVIKKYFPALEVVDSICGATKDRQDALRELCEKTDAVIIAGGAESANTQRLLSLAKQLGKPAWLVEDVSQIPPEICTYETIGLSAGASTPDDLIDEIEEALRAES